MTFSIETVGVNDSVTLTKVVKSLFLLVTLRIAQTHSMSIFTEMTMFIIEPKLGPFSVNTVRNMITANALGGELSEDQLKASVILTGMKAPARLARHVPIVDVKWINDSVKAGEKLSLKHYQIHIDIESPKSEAIPAQNTVAPRQAEEEPAGSTSTDSSEEEIDIDPNFNNSFYECLRPTPLYPKYNKELVHLLELLEAKRHTNGESMSSLSYRHAVAAIKAYPREIKSVKEAEKIKGVGKKIKQAIKLYLKTGTIPEAKRIESDIQFHTMSKFLKVWGVGANLALEWWNSGYRSLEEVYDNASLSPTIRLGIELFEEFDQRLTREDCKEILDIVEREAKEILPGSAIYPVGGYRAIKYCRRGKDSNGDVDLILSHPDELKNQGFLRKLVDHLTERGYVRHKLRFSEPSADRLEGSSLQDANKDLIDSCYTAFLQPSTASYIHVYWDGLDHASLKGRYDRLHLSRLSFLVALWLCDEVVATGLIELVLCSLSNFFGVVPVVVFFMPTTPPPIDALNAA
ncbi:hypothetical protein NQZ79_g5097 [Umbelopsis isabellina]|nr:hypothetical protein NQZ79_g5097 [Umbelopsis isabellina]